MKPAPGSPTSGLSRRAVLGQAAAALGAAARALDASAQDATPASAREPLPGTSQRQPNIILVVADDLRTGDLGALPNVRALLADRGASFANYFVTTPLCGPSRASILRGQYAHNHGVLTNTGEHGGFTTFRRLGREASTVATWLRTAGYRTALFGKYLNGFPKGVGPEYVPPGWDEWFGLASKQPSYLDYELNENGRVVAYGRGPEDYSTDVLAGHAADFVRRSAAGQPFFAYLAPLAPHWPAVPAPRHAAALPDATSPRPPSFNEADVGDKPRWVRGAPELGSEQVRGIDELHRQRLRSLLAVDEMVAALVEVLGDAGALETTYLLLTSDNGLLAGEHRLAAGKQAPYEEAIRVPLLVRGPGVSAGEVVEALALNTDLAPTIAELAGAGAPDFVDGRSLVPLLRGEQPAARRRAFLVELFAVIRAEGKGSAPGESGEGGEEGSGVPPYRGLRTPDALYVEYETGDRELYDLRADPYEMDNRVASADPTLLARLSARLAELTDCGGTSCRAAEDAHVEPQGS